MLLESVFLLTLASQGGTCAAALAAAPHYAACAEGRSGTSLSATQEGADLLLARAEAAAPRFRHHFAEDPAPYLVFYFEDEPPLGALRDAGFATVLAWPSPAKLGELLSAALRQNALAQGGGGALSEEAEAALRLQTAAVLASQEMKQEGILSHELGHIWYEAAFWRDSDSTPDGYGTPAPDWLDETAAVLTEGDTLGESRRRLFAEGWTVLEPSSRSASSAIGDLGHFLQRRHPSQVQATAPSDAAAATSVTATVRVRSGPSASEAYYNQVRVFADYMIARTGDAAVFSEISRVVAAGTDFEAWLGSQTRYPTLPRTVPDVQADWASWIDGGAVTPRTSPPAPAAVRD